MTTFELLSNEYNNRVNKKMYEIISLTSFYCDEMNWSLYNFKYYYKNIKLILLTFFIIIFDFILFFIFILIIFSYFYV